MSEGNITLGNRVETEALVIQKLQTSGVLTKMDYDSIVDELSKYVSSDRKTPPSALHVLRDRGFDDLTEMLTSLSSDSGIPMLPLGLFEPQKLAFSMLDTSFMTYHGAIPFDMLDSELLVGILNPYDKALQAAVSEQTGRKCFFYLVSPNDYDKTLQTIIKSLQPD